MRVVHESHFFFKLLVGHSRLLISFPFEEVLAELLMSGLLSGQELFDIISLFVLHLLRLYCWQPFHEIEVVSISFVKSACVVFTLFSLNLDRVFGIFLVVAILIDDVLSPEVIVERNLSVESLPHH
jgi:hypothetical protein